MYALNASTGARLWSFDSGNFNHVFSSPAVANGVVYIGSDGGALYALKCHHRRHAVELYRGECPIRSAPTVANSVVYVSSYDHNLYALNTATGALLWSYAAGGPLTSSPAVADGAVYFSGADSNLYALNAGTGAKLWSYSANIDAFTSPAIANGCRSLYPAAVNKVVALNATTGVKLWSYTTGGGIFSSPAVANGAVFVGSGDGNVYALNASTGARLWSYFAGIPNGYSPVLSSPAIANGVVYFGSSNINTVNALNASTGALLWSYTTGGNVVSSPAVVDGVVYIGSCDGSVYAFSLASADLFLRIRPTTTTVHQGDLLTYAFPVWNLGPDDADQEVLTTQVPAGTTLDYIRISGTPGLGTCTAPPYQGTGKIVCHENSSMAPNTTWTVRVTVKVTAPAGTVITENAATMADTFDPNLANNTATVSTTVQ